MFGQRLRHARRARGLTLADLGARVGRTPSVLSLIENGTPGAAAVAGRADRDRARRAGHRAAQEAAAEPPRPARGRALEQRPARPVLHGRSACPSCGSAPGCRPRCSSTWSRSRPSCARSGPSPPPPRRRRGRPTRRCAARCASAATTSPTSRRRPAPRSSGPDTSAARSRRACCCRWSPTHGFSVRFVADLPRSVRSLTDLRASRIYVKQEPVGGHSPRAVILQALGHFLLGHDTPRDFADFLRQRVEANYFAAAMLIPEQRRGPVPAAPPRNAATWPSRTWSTCSRSATRWPRTGSPT